VPSAGPDHHDPFAASAEAPALYRQALHPAAGPLFPSWLLQTLSAPTACRMTAPMSPHAHR